MSIEIMNAVWRESKADGRARLVLLAIADHQGEIGAWPSIKRLAQMVNSSERSVQRDIQHLQKIGELRVEVQNAPTSGQYKSNRYFITLPSTSGVTESQSGVTDLASGVTDLASGVTAGGVQSLIEPLEETLSNTHVSELFDEFWKIYPRKSDKRAALRAFKSALSRVSFEDIMAGVHRYATDPNLPDMSFIKHPATWLNADAWENGPLPERKGKKTTDWDALKRWAQENEEN
jgi:X-X-X-Leu-X-X-Gly heptad repeat protein